MKSKLAILITIAIFVLFAFRSIVVSPNTNLLDWYDYPLYSWTVNHNIEKIKNLDFSNYFSTRSFANKNNTLLLSDTLIPQSLIALPFSFYTKNPILLFNITFILTFILNAISTYIFWVITFKKKSLGLIGSLITTFSPYTFSQLSHFQMISFWPFFLSLAFLELFVTNKKNYFLYLSALFSSIQFYSSTYLAIFLVPTVLILLIADTFYKRNLKLSLAYVLQYITIFVLLSSPLIVGYEKIKKEYNIKREYGEYITYSAHLSDYIFPRNTSSILYQQKFWFYWNKFDKHIIGEHPIFPGFVLSLLPLVYLLKIFNNHKKIQLNIIFSYKEFAFFVLLVVGLVFSLGPRINFNGNYGEIPLPYHLIIKIIPPLQLLRSVSRWSFLFYLALTFFSLSAINLIKRKIFIVLLVIFIILEYYPLNLSSFKESYITVNDIFLSQKCNLEKTKVLEYPVTHFNVGGGVVKGLNYISKMQLATTYSHCNIINGYSGYDFPDLRLLDQNLHQLLENSQLQLFIETVKDTGAEIVVINEGYLTESDKLLYRSNKSQLKKLLNSPIDNVYILN